MRVKVYRNLHKNAWSVVKASTGRVIFHADTVTLRNVQWRVQPAGNRLVRQCNRKNVHAYAVGDLVSLNPTLTLGHRVRYSPYTMQTFQTVEGTPVHTSSVAEFTGMGLAYAPCDAECK